MPDMNFVDSIGCTRVRRIASPGTVVLLNHVFLEVGNLGGMNLLTGELFCYINKLGTFSCIARE